MEEKKAVFHVARSLQAGYVNHQKERHEFAFDGVLGAEATQQDVFQCVAKPVVQRSLEGFNGTVFAYGQTGSGKTFTITGGPERRVEELEQELCLLKCSDKEEGDV
eukprot:jgi/Pico_ML_1/53289/g3861.t1